MIRIKARIKLYKNDTGRKMPFISGYKPLFNFIPEMKKSGQIRLTDRQSFFPGDEGIVEIKFLNKDYLGNNWKIGTKFTFGEGKEPMGEGEVNGIIENT